MKSELVTYHVNHSSGVGGIENLYSDLHSIAAGLSWNVKQVFHGVSGMRKIIHNNGSVIDVQLPSLFSNRNRVGKWIRYFLFAVYFCSFASRKPGILLLVDPGALFFIPKRFLKTKKVVLVQSNRADIYLNRMASSVMVRKSEIVNRIVPYTHVDTIKIKDILAGLSVDVSESKFVEIPRSCRLDLKLKPVSVPKPSLVMVARIDEHQKNFESAVKILELLPECVLHIYGDGEACEVSSLKKRIAKHSNILFHGVTKNVEAALDGKAVFLMTSRYEGFGQTLVEARSQGLPIVAFDTFDALSTIVVDGKNGYRIPNGDERLFAEKVREIIQSAPKYSAMVSSSIEQAKKTTKTSVDLAWEELFRGVLSE